MAGMTIRRKGEILRGLVEMLTAVPDGMPAGEALAQLRSRFPLTDYEKGVTESGAVRFDVNIRFATTDLAKAAWLEKNKGRWSVTEAGKKAFLHFKDPEAFYREASRLYREWRHSTLRPISDEDGDPAEEEARSVQVTFEQAEEQAWKEIEQHLRDMPPFEFQELVASLLRAMGYFIAWVAPPGKDGGTDILAWGDPLGTRPPRIKVQVKRVQQAVSVDGLRSFLAVLGEDDVGIFVSTGGFTRDAQDEARTRETRKVTLIDLEKLFDLWVEHYSRLDDKARRQFPIQPIWFLAPST